MATEHFCLRWNNHQSTLVSVFDNLLESGTLVDCTLAADGRYLKAHKVVLSACSPYLGMLLSQHYDKHPIIILKDVKFDELKAMLDYMYRGEVNISQEQLSTFLKAAETLQIKGLTDTGGEEGNGIHPTRPPSSNSTTSIPNDDPPSPGEGGSSPSPRKRKRNKHSDEPPDGETQPKAGTSDASDRLNREGVSISGTVNLNSPGSKNSSFGNVKRELTETDGDGQMSVDDSGDSAMMSRPGPSSGGSTNNKGSPWLLPADSTAEEMQMTPGQGGAQRVHEVINIEDSKTVIDLDPFAEDVKPTTVKLVPLRKKEHCLSPVANTELTRDNLQNLNNSISIINSNTVDELIIPDMIDCPSSSSSVQPRSFSATQSTSHSSCQSVNQNVNSFSFRPTQIRTDSNNGRWPRIARPPRPMIRLARNVVQRHPCNNLRFTRPAAPGNDAAKSSANNNLRLTKPKENISKFRNILPMPSLTDENKKQNNESAQPNNIINQQAQVRNQTNVQTLPTQNVCTTTSIDQSQVLSPNCSVGPLNTSAVSRPLLTFNLSPSSGVLQHVISQPGQPFALPQPLFVTPAPATNPQSSAADVGNKVMYARVDGVVKRFTVVSTQTTSKVTSVVPKQQ